MYGALGAMGKGGLGTCSVGKCGTSALRAKCVDMLVLVAGRGRCAAPLVRVVRPCAIQHATLGGGYDGPPGGTGVMAGDGSGEEGGAKWWRGREGGGEGGKSAGFDAWTQTSAARLISSRVGELKLGHGA